MQFSESWLRSLCNPALDSDALCKLLTMAGLEVEEVDPVAPEFSGVVVARIVSFEKHPNADKLKVCRVDVGQGDLLQIVCGAPNVVEGMKAPCAMVGAKLPEFTIKPAKLRGMESFGMMCAADELGISADHAGLMVLPEDAPIGTNLRDYLQLDDRKITIKLTPNRADCLSLAGVAREVAALTDTPWVLPAISDVAATHNEQRTVVLDASDGCPRFLGRVIKGVNARAATPGWMRQRLERSGLRSINVVVDITNYVMLELGQPMHAYDANQLKGSIHARWADGAEQITLLNGQVVTPTKNTLLIADEARPLGIAGIMGGENTGTTEETTTVFLESAFFRPEAIAGRAREYGFSSDASHRYERGVDPALPQRAMARASQLIAELCGGEFGPVAEAVQAEQIPVCKPVGFRPARARKVLGFEIDDATMLASLQRLGMQIEGCGESVTVTAPSYRFDIEIEEDLIEEVARVYGYDNIPAVPPKAPLLMQPRTETARPVHRLRRLVAGLDYQEIISYAFVEEAWERDFAGNTNPVRLANPIASQMSVMRSTLLGGLVGALAGNLRRRASRVRLFEVGRCFAHTDSEQPVPGYLQPVRVAGLAWGPAEPEQWGSATRKVDFYDVKHDVEQILGNSAEFVAEKHAGMHPGRCAAIRQNGTLVGFVGELHPALVQRYELGTAPVVFELSLDAALSAKVPAFAELPKHQAVQRDLAVVLNNTVTSAKLLDVLRAAGGTIVRSVDVFDVYTGKGIDADQKSIALRVTLQHAERSLEDTEIEDAMRALVSAAERELGGRLRA
jgi:phenylalanyl-tRNA synthetase beta chain